MSVPVLGLNKSKFRRGTLAGTRHANTPIGGLTTSNQTFIPTLNNDTVAIIDSIRINWACADVAATVLTVTITLNGVELVFCEQTQSGRIRNPTTLLRPKGTLMVTPGNSMLAKTNAIFGTNGSIAFLSVDYRLMSVTKAIEAGYMTGTPFVACLNSTLTTTPVTMVPTATVTTGRGIEINGIAITGRQSNATGGAAKTVLVEFLDPGASTHRKVFKNCYATNDPSGSPAMIVNDCKIRGPLGYGLRVTAGETASNASVVVWGQYYSGSQKTYPGTGVPPTSLTGSFDAGEYFWIFEDTTTGSSASPHNYIFPNTTVASSEDMVQVDGYAISSTQNATCIATHDLMIDSLNVPVSAALACFGGAGVVPGASLVVDDDAGIVVRLDDKLAVRATVALGAVTELGCTVWGRFLGGGSKAASTARDWVQAS